MKTPNVPGLPNPNDAPDSRTALLTEAANDAVETVVRSDPGSRKRKRGEYTSYDEDIRAKIARYSIDNGVAKTSRKFSADMGRKVSESTVRSMRDQYITLKKTSVSEPSALPKSPRGNPLLLGNQLDGEVQDWIRKVRVHGGVINSRIVMLSG